MTSETRSESKTSCSMFLFVQFCVTFTKLTQPNLKLDLFGTAPFALFPPILLFEEPVV